MINIRYATEHDISIVLKFIKELAQFENLTNSCTISEDDLKKLIIIEQLLHAIIISINGTDIGFSTFFYMISTFKGKKILYIEDLFIKKSVQKQGLGKYLMESLEKAARENDCIGMEWKCLTWNKNAQKFYKDFQGEMDTEWITYKKFFQDENHS